MTRRHWQLSFVLTALYLSPSLWAETSNRFEVLEGSGTTRLCSATVDASDASIHQDQTIDIRPYKCFNRRLRVEVDQQAGIAGGIPTNQADTTGTILNLHEIFVPVSIGVDVWPDDNNVPDYDGPAGCFSRGELDSLMDGGNIGGTQVPVWQDASSADAGDWNVYGFFGDCENTGMVGGIYTSAAHGRDRFIFFINTINATGTFLSTAPGLLRATAHEIGHTLNLYHDDGDSQCTANGVTIMNQSGTIGLGVWQYQFSASSRSHFATHPQLSIEPGSSVKFGCCQPPTHIAGFAGCSALASCP